MSSASLDALLGRALTDDAFRARLLADPRGAMDGYALSDDERRETLDWTGARFAAVLDGLDAGIARARFDGAGFETAADAAAAVVDRLAPEQPASLSASATAADVGEAHLRRAGIVRHVAESCVYWDAVPLYGCSVLYGGRYAGRRYVLPNVSGGRGTTPAAARRRALAEAAERFAAAVYDERAFVLGSYSKLAGEAVPPSAFALFSAAQHAEPEFPHAPFDEQTRIRWTWGRMLRSQRPVLVPAAFVHRPYWPAGGETMPADLPSTGLACGRTVEEAALNGLYEVIERDAIAIAWLNRLAVPTVDAGVTSTCGARTLSVHDISTDLGVPVRLALLINAHETIAAVGAAARLDPHAATAAAVAEALTLEPVVRANRARCAAPPRHAGDVRTIEDHMLFYSDPVRIGDLQALRDVPATLPSPAPQIPAGGDELASMIESFSRRALEPIVVDLTLPEIAAAGLHVVRVLVPGLIPLTFGTRLAAKGGARLYRVPVDLGYRGAPLREDQLNPLPHPFA